MEPSEKGKISVILPTFNENKNIAPLIDSVQRELANFDHEILVVDDSSDDGTYETVLGLSQANIKPILRVNDRGLAKSIRTGIENATGNILIVMDSDFNHQPEYIPGMIKALSDHDAVFASRFLKGGGMKSPLHQTLSRIFNLFVQLMTGSRVKDNLYGFFAIKRDVLEKCDYEDVFRGYGDYCMRLLCYLQETNANILEVAALNGERAGGKSKSRFFWVFRQYFTATIKLAYRIRIKRRCAGK